MISHPFRLLAFYCGFTAFGACAEVIDLQFLVDQSLGTRATDRTYLVDKLNKEVAELNEMFRNSQVSLSAKIVRVEFIPIRKIEAADILDAMANEQDGFASLFESARQYGADFSISIANKLLLRGKRICGKAYAVNKTVAEVAELRRALAVIDSACGSQTLAHELGHLMGLNHGDKVDECAPGKGHKTAIAPYAKGYATGACNGTPRPEKFGTIMVGGWMKAINGDGHGNLRIFSNPRIHDARCGISGVCGNPSSGDAARALNENAHHYAGHANRK